jgi:hypothetical protein
MRFEQKTQFGLLGETLVADLIRFDESKRSKNETHEVKINTGPGLLNSYGIRYHSSDGTSEVVPDIEVVERAYLKPTKTLFMEVKTKTAFCAWHNGSISEPTNWGDGSWEIRTGIDVKAWWNYRWYYQKHYQNPLWLIFVHPLNLIQLRKRIGVVQPRISGIYRAELGQLIDLAKHGAGKQYGNMIYWPIECLERWRPGLQAAKRRASENVWRDLVSEATKHSKRIQLIDPERNIQIT